MLNIRILLLQACAYAGSAVADIQLDVISLYGVQHGYD
jgi:hypothetical protein